MKFTYKIFTLLLLLICHLAQAQITQDNATVKGNNQFAIELYKKLAQGKSTNFFVSPYSVSSALAMTYAGAKGATAQEMAKVLHFTPDRLHQDNKLLANHFDMINQKGLKLKVANALWAEKTQKFLPAYLTLNNKYYKAKASNLDFKLKPEQSRLIINKWVEGKTNKKIKNLIPKGLIDENTRLVLTNAIYFKGDWKYTFKKKQTKKMLFIAGTKRFPGTKFMRMQRRFRYTESKLLQAVELPYKDDKMSMLVLLPKDKNGLNKLEKQLSAQKLAQLMEGSFYTKVKLSLPRFKMMISSKLKAPLKQLGMRTAFSNQADFTGMTKHAELKISEVVHKAFVEVNEKGTEAAAATAVIVRAKSTSVRHKLPTPPKIFKADHPFIFIIKDNQTGSILFIGKLENPQSAS